jgi:GAF domain-containing protein
MQQETGTRTSQASVSAALAATNGLHRDSFSKTTLSELSSALRMGSDSPGRSLAEMAQRDLDAALQLLTDRAQYITGSTGAAIALRRSGTNDMLCRASSGSNAPELGTLLSTEFGLSGESVRTRRPLRCDDAERDARVNRDVCREVGIASVVVMPVVHDDEVLGVFELFSGRAHAFGERDMSALKRLSEMVETAVKLAQAAQGIPERWIAEDKIEASAGVAAPQVSQLDDFPQLEDPLLNDSLIEVETETALTAAPLPAGELEKPVVPQTGAHDLAKTVVAAAASIQSASIQSASAQSATVQPEGRHAESINSVPGDFASANLASAILAASRSAPSTPAPTAPAPARKPILWSATENIDSATARPSESEQSHVPPVFRHLRKCDACGFPVSSERALCVECEEKKWRGQFKKPPATTLLAGSGAAAAVAPALDVRKPDAKAETPSVLTIPSAASQSTPGKDLPAKDLPTKEKKVDLKVESAPAQKAEAHKADTKEAAVTQKVQAPAVPTAPTMRSPVKTEMPPTTPVSASVPIFGAGLEPSQSWLSRNKYVLGAMLAIAGAIAAILLVR